MKLLSKVLTHIIFVSFVVALNLNAIAAENDPLVKYPNNVIVKGFTTKNSKGVNGITDNLLRQNFKQILTTITILKSGKLGEIMDLFLNNGAKWAWVINEGTLPENINAATELISGIAITTLDYDKLKNATNVSIARTIMHEMVHAYLSLYFKHDTVNANKAYPGILLAWLSNKNPDYNLIQHTEIENNFVGEIADFLYEFAQVTGITNVAKSVYVHLAWRGLNFEDNALLTVEEKESIQHRISAEQLNRVFGTESPVGNEMGTL